MRRIWRVRARADKVHMCGFLCGLKEDGMIATPQTKRVRFFSGGCGLDEPTWHGAEHRPAYRRGVSLGPVAQRNTRRRLKRRRGCRKGEIACEVHALTLMAAIAARWR